MLSLLTNTRFMHNIIINLTGVQWEKHVFDEGQDSVILDVSRLTECFLQLLLHLLLLIQEINLGFLRSKMKIRV